jgi:tetratricopeptide (TPR) repeat protein
MRLSPVLAEGYELRGRVRLKLDDGEGAVADFCRAIELNPAEALAYLNRGTTYLGMADYERALADFETAIRLDPNCASSIRDQMEQARKALKR